MHLEVLSRLSMLLMDDEFRTNLLDAADVTEFLAHIDEAERKKFPEEYGEEKQMQDQPEEGYRVLAVTACPTGIAHTYMAAESLENKAKEMGISIKVETNGSGGAKNVLTPEEIAQCECIIIAADKFGMGNPFSGFLKQVGDISFGMMFPILAVYIAMAIADRPALMPGIVGGLLAKSGMTMAAEEAGWVSSGFFGALIAGFAVAGLIMLGLKKILEKLPKTLEGTKPMLLYPFLGIAAMGALMVFVVNPPVGAFNEWLNQVLASMGESSRVLLGAALGGMVPPIGIALATLFFKNRFTKSEQQTVATNFIMGLSFITEGAIPFAVSDPLLFLAAVAAGSVVAMLGIVLLKKPLAAK